MFSRCGCLGIESWKKAGFICHFADKPIVGNSMNIQNLEVSTIAH